MKGMNVRNINHNISVLSSTQFFIYVDITIQFALHGDIYNITFVLYLCKGTYFI